LSPMQNIVVFQDRQVFHNFNTRMWPV
jgi:hypothetical protein